MTFFLILLLVCIALFTFRFMFMIDDKQKFLRQKIHYMGERLPDNPNADLEGFRSNPHFDLKKVDFLTSENKLYQDLKQEYLDLQVARENFWKIEGKVYLIVGVISGVLLVIDSL